MLEGIARCHGGIPEGGGRPQGDPESISLPPFTANRRSWTRTEDLGSNPRSATYQLGDVGPAVSHLFFFFFLIYLFMRDIERQRHRQREKQASSGEPNAGLDPRILGSHPGPKAALNP